MVPMKVTDLTTWRVIPESRLRFSRVVLVTAYVALQLLDLRSQLLLVPGLLILRQVVPLATCTAMLKHINKARQKIPAHVAKAPFPSQIFLGENRRLLPNDPLVRSAASLFHVGTEKSIGRRRSGARWHGGLALAKLDC